MGFRRIGFVWFFSTLSAVVFLAIVASLPGGPTDGVAGPAAADTLVPVSAPLIQHAIERPAPDAETQDLAPMLETRALNVDRRGVVVPVTRAGALLSAEAYLILP